MNNKDIYVFGGYLKDNKNRAKSTSGGAFTAIVQAWCGIYNNYVIFGAENDGLTVKHSYITNINELDKFRKSKYSQSKIGESFKDVKKFLIEGKRVLFSGTPCQIAGLKSYLNKEYDSLLLVEVVCEGVPTPHYIDRLNEFIKNKYGSPIKTLDYRYKDVRSLQSPMKGKWDFEVMQASLESGKKIKIDRWFNPFWSIWLKHLMSRPSCYKCPFAKPDRNADITLGDLWGVHIYCPELYGHNAGASLIVCNTTKGKEIFNNAKEYLYGHELDFNEALKYQGPMKNHIANNPNRNEFMNDIKVMDYKTLTNKWATKPTLKLLFQKYVWGNRQKVWLWNLLNK